MEYTRNDLPQKAVRDTMSGVFESLGVRQVTTCYSHSKNIKDVVTKARFHQVSGKEAKKYYLGELSVTW